MSFKHKSLKHLDTTLMNQFADKMIKQYGPIPESFTFGDGIDWNSDLVETHLYVELPFWLMVPPGDVRLKCFGIDFTVTILGSWREVFGGEFTDSRRTCFHQGPSSPMRYEPQEKISAVIKEQNFSVIERECKTMLRISAYAHLDAFIEEGPDEPPRAEAENSAYRASLCEAHIPVVNELIQRYRLKTYDYFAYEVSAWDVPIWYLKQNDQGYRAVLHPYREWDAKPVVVSESSTENGLPEVHHFEWAKPSDLESLSSADSSAGEFDLLDARSLMERGDYSGAVRRTTTAIEALIAAKLEEELLKNFDSAETARRLKKSQNNVPERIREWRALSKSQAPESLFLEFDKTRKVRHGIVHRADRLTHNERGTAQRMVDTGRWLYNHIEGKPDRARLRDYNVQSSIGRLATAVRFPTKITNGGLVLEPIRNI